MDGLYLEVKAHGQMNKEATLKTLKTLITLLLILIPFICHGAGIMMIGGSTGSTTLTLDDSYSESNVSDYATINATYNKYSQSYTSGGGELDSIKYYMYKAAGASGNMNAKVYAHTGTYGTSSVPTGSALATSDTIDASTLGQDVGNIALITFSFTGANRIALSAATYYCITIEYAGATNIKLGQDQTSPTHGGNEAYYDASWHEEGYDNAFYIYVYR